MERTVTWTPDPAEELFRLPETAVDISYAVSVEVEDELGMPVAVTGYQVEIEPVQQVLDVATGAGGVTISAEQLAGLFPIQHIDYWQDGNVVRIPDWESLPAEAQQLVEYRPSTTREQVFTMSVTALLEDATQETAQYTLVVTQDWSAGRDRLMEEVDARR